ncbi:hypothetical protein NP233_g4541 [Leucocoprinus birnbaumii]|uniref:Nephrocystin 3-like N-terminal domain-containing protein n=1 Tax=Leucocoprinus birnbaumii TaxID=56174 RepID=A0AAD5VWZ0_9AGAR|nr:hypothetical protein NP233_g4541 [Leucocoprinus birnbaumii]
MNLHSSKYTASSSPKSSLSAGKRDGAGALQIFEQPGSLNGLLPWGSTVVQSALSPQEISSQYLGHFPKPRVTTVHGLEPPSLGVPDSGPSAYPTFPTAQENEAPDMSQQTTSFNNTHLRSFLVNNSDPPLRISGDNHPLTSRPNTAFMKSSRAGLPSHRAQRRHAPYHLPQASQGLDSAFAMENFSAAPGTHYASGSHQSRPSDSSNFYLPQPSHTPTANSVPPLLPEASHAMTPSNGPTSNFFPLQTEAMPFPDVFNAMQGTSESPADDDISWFMDMLNRFEPAAINTSIPMLNDSWNQVPPEISISQAVNLMETDQTLYPSYSNSTLYPIEQNLALAQSSMALLPHAHNGAQGVSINQSPAATQYSQEPFQLFVPSSQSTNPQQDLQYDAALTQQSYTQPALPILPVPIHEYPPFQLPLGLESTKYQHPSSQHKREEGVSYTGVLSGAQGIVMHHPTFVENRTHHSEGNYPLFLGLEDAHSDVDTVLQWMEPEVMEGAEFDSSERAPPPRCHPGTRTSIIERLNGWVMDPIREKRLLWLQGPAGVGKSAIIQTLVETLSKESGQLGATLFFSRPNGRSNPQQVIPTIAYQLALLDNSYKAYIHELSLRKPRALKTAMQEQFNLLIVEPFVQRRIRSGSADILIAIDGLDECDGDSNHEPTLLHRGRSLEAVHREIVQLISDFVKRNPDVPIIWAIASRPEDHLKAVFSAEGIQGTFLEVEIPIDSDEACRDVENYLVASFTEIRTQYPNQFRESTAWPSHVHFLQIAKAALGLFVFAEVVIRFVGDERVGNPISQLGHVLSALTKIKQSEQPRNPLEVLDAIYTTIMERVPNDMITNTKQLLEILVFFQHRKKNISDFTFRDMCEYLMIPHEDAVSALRHLHSVVFFAKGKIEEGRPRFFHASFSDFLENPARSKGFSVIKWEIDAHRLLEVLMPKSSNDANQKGVHRLLIQVLQMQSLPSSPEISVKLLNTEFSLSAHQLQSIFEYFDLSDFLSTDDGFRVVSRLPIRDENGSWADDLRRRGCFSVARLDSLSKPPSKPYRILPRSLLSSMTRDVAYDYMNSSLHSLWTASRVKDWSANLARLYAEKPETKVLIWGHQNGKQCAVILRNDLPDWWMIGDTCSPGEVYISGFSRLK